jgi:hypothetical protein
MGRDGDGVAVPRRAASSGLQSALCETDADAFSSHQESINCTLAAYDVPFRTLADRTGTEIYARDLDSAQVRSLQPISFQACDSPVFPCISYDGLVSLSGSRSNVFSDDAKLIHSCFRHDVM